MNNEIDFMKRTPVYLFLLLLVLFSCKNDNKKLIAGKWHVVKFENNMEMLVGKWNAVQMSNPEMDSFFKNSQVYIDTVGKHNDAAANLQLYGVANMDSMRVILQKQYDSAKLMQANAVTNTSFYFGDDGVAILSFHGNIDSSSWYIDSVGNLVLDDLNEAGKGQKLNLEIVTISDTVLKLRFQENNSFSVVTFHPQEARKSKPMPIVEAYFTFRTDSVVVMSFNGAADSNKWYFENDSVITVKSLGNKPSGGHMQWNILALEEKKLELKIVENSSVSILTFSREGK
jgi:hypothetical protein